MGEEVVQSFRSYLRLHGRFGIADQILNLRVHKLVLNFFLLVIK